MILDIFFRDQCCAVLMCPKLKQSIYSSFSGQSLFKTVEETSINHSTYVNIHISKVSKGLIVSFLNSPCNSIAYLKIRVNIFLFQSVITILQTMILFTEQLDTIYRSEFNYYIKIDL